MAKNVQAQVAGGEIKQYRGVDEVSDLREKIGLGKDHTATINGEPAADGDELNDYDFVSFAPAVKGGSR